MKRYKVVQDARGHWGIWDTEADDFASWGDYPLAGGQYIDEIANWAGKLNIRDATPEEFSWDGGYLPRERTDKMTLEFVVFNDKGREIDWIDPYQGHVDNGDGTYEVDNGYAIYHVVIPETGRYVIRTLDLENS